MYGNSIWLNSFALVQIALGWVAIDAPARVPMFIGPAVNLASGRLVRCRFRGLFCQTFDSKTGVELFQFGLLTAIIGLSPFVANGDSPIDKGLYALVTNGDNSVPSGYNPIHKPLSPPVGGIIDCSSIKKLTYD